MISNLLELAAKDQADRQQNAIAQKKQKQAVRNVKKKLLKAMNKDNCEQLGEMGEMGEMRERPASPLQALRDSAAAAFNLLAQRSATRERRSTAQASFAVSSLGAVNTQGSRLDRQGALLNSTINTQGSFLNAGHAAADEAESHEMSALTMILSPKRTRRMDDDDMVENTSSGTNEAMSAVATNSSAVATNSSAVAIPGSTTGVDTPEKKKTLFLMVGMAQENCKVMARVFLELDDIVSTAQVGSVIVGLTKSGTVRSLVQLNTKILWHEKIDDDKNIFEGCGCICSIQSRDNILVGVTVDGEIFVCKHAGKVFWEPDKLELDHPVTHAALAPAETSNGMMVVTWDSHGHPLFHEIEYDIFGDFEHCPITLASTSVVFKAAKSMDKWNRVSLQWEDDKAYALCRGRITGVGEENESLHEQLTFASFKVGRVKDGSGSVFYGINPAIPGNGGTYIRLLFPGNEGGCNTDYLFVQGAIQSFDCQSVFFHVLFDLDERWERTDKNFVDENVVYDDEDVNIAAIDAAHNAARNKALKTAPKTAPKTATITTE